MRPAHVFPYVCLPIVLDHFFHVREPYPAKDIAYRERLDRRFRTQSELSAKQKTPTND